MPKVSINIIKDWFKNQSKPPQEHFWAWLESFWHKDEPIPQSAVENLASTLQKKADLVDGVVPESQLPFSVVTSEVIALGAVTVTENLVTLPVHSSGANKVRVKGQLITRTFPNEWPFTPIFGNGFKTLRGYAVKGETDFFMAESAELPEVTDAEIPEGALELFKFTISLAGVVLEQNESNGYKLQAEDAFRQILITDDNPVTVNIAGSPASSFNLIVASTSNTPTIGQIRTKFKKNTRDGHKLTFYNDSTKDITFLAGASSEGADFTNYGLATEFVLKPGMYQDFKRRNNLYEVKGGGGSAEFPAGNPGDVLVKGAEDWEASSRLTDVEDATDMLMDELSEEIADRTAADNLLQFQIDAEEGRNNTQDAQIAAKQDKSMFSALVDKWIHYYDSTTQKMQPILKFVSGVANQLEFTGRIKADAIVLPTNLNPVVPNRLRSDGEDVFFSNLSSVEKRLIKTPSVSGDFITYSDVLALDASGNPARVAASSIDFPSLLFVSNAKWMMPNANATTYSVFRSATPVVVSASTNGVQPKPAVNYNSNGSTISFQRGNPLLNNGALRWRHIRNFDINTTIASQRIFVGISDNYLTVAPTNVPISTSIGYGIAMIEGSSNIHFVGDVILDTGIVNSTNKEYILDITGVGTVIKISITAISSGSSVSASYTFTGTQRKCPVIWCVDALESSVVRVRDYGAYDEQKYY